MLLFCCLVLGFFPQRYENLLVLWFNFTYSGFGYRLVSEPRHGLRKAMYKVLCLTPSYTDNAISAVKVELSVLHKGIVCPLR